MALRAVQDDDITVAKLYQDVIVAKDCFVRFYHRVYLPVRLAGKQECTRIFLIETCLVFLGHLP